MILAKTPPTMRTISTTATSTVKTKTIMSAVLRLARFKKLMFFLEVEIQKGKDIRQNVSPIGIRMAGASVGLRCLGDQPFLKDHAGHYGPSMHDRKLVGRNHIAVSGNEEKRRTGCAKTSVGRSVVQCTVMAAVGAVDVIVNVAVVVTATGDAFIQGSGVMQVVNA